MVHKVKKIGIRKGLNVFSGFFIFDIVVDLISNS